MNDCESVRAGVRRDHHVVRVVPGGDVPAVRRAAAVRGAALPAQRGGALLCRVGVHLPEVLRARHTRPEALRSHY